MSINSYLLIHKDHPINLDGVNSGAEMATLSMAYQLARMGKHVVVAAELRPTAIVPRVDSANQISYLKNAVEFWDLGADFNTLATLNRMSSQGKYHLISGGRAQAILESRNDKRCVSRTLIIHDPSGAALGVRADIVTKIADKIICVSQAQKELFLQNGADPEKISIVHNGADLDLFAAGDPDKRDYQKMIFVGALVQDKGIVHLINSFSEIKQKFPNATLDVYGSSSMWGRNELFDKNEIESKLAGIKFHGAVSQAEVAKAYQKAGILVIPSIWFDSFPLTAVEGQVSGIPVVGFGVGGIKEAVINAETGVIIDQVSQAALIETLSMLLKDSTKLKAMSKAALTHARVKFSWEIAAKEVIEICEKAASLKQKALIESKIGYLSTWNQHCGLATYARYQLSEFEKGSYIVLAEDAAETQGAARKNDETFVIRCWKRGTSDFSALRKAIQDNGIKLLHLNCHYSFFPQPAFANFIKDLKASGVKVVSLIHNPYTVEQNLKELVNSVDQVLVHTEENRLEIIANGASAEKVRVLPHGVFVKTEEDRKALRIKLAMPYDRKILVSFGFIQPHKGMHAIIEAVAYLKSRGITAKGYIIGEPMASDSQSKPYLEHLKNIVSENNLNDSIEFISRFVSDQEVSQYLAAADLVVMNYQSQHYEASGACSLAVGAGALVATSVAPPFAFFGKAVWHMTSGYPPHLSAEMLLTNQHLAKEIKTQALKYCQQYNWSAVKQLLLEFYSDLGFQPKADHILEEKVVENINSKTMTMSMSRSCKKSIRILMQNRPTVFTHRGGDTVLMEKTIEGLKKLGVDVTVDINGSADPKNFDIVHLYNFATPDFTRALAERAQRAGVPYVVTTLNEDIASFHEQSRAWAGLLVNYVRNGQNSDWWSKNKFDPQQIPASKNFDNKWTAQYAAALLTNGAQETATIKRDYPGARTIEVKLGCEVGVTNAKADSFIQTYGLKDFIFCVGRIESRKNQLGLLKALENIDIPVVFAGGGFTYQPEYLEALKSFKRKAQVLILDRISPEMLASAYMAAKIHVLPSWYELPGLVSLEAAHYSKNVVVTRSGTAIDYLGSKAFYCDSADEDSIRNAVLAAYYSPVVSGLRETVSNYSWDNVAKETLAVYQQFANIQQGVSTSNDSNMGRQNTNQSINTIPQVADGGIAVYDFSSSATEFQDLLEKGELAAKNREYAKAHELLDRAEKMQTTSGRLMRAKGAVFLADNQVKEAREYFNRALKIQATDAKALVGCGLCEMNAKNTEAAYDYYLHALKHDQNQLVALHQLVECSFMLSRFNDLERCLRTYLANNPSDTEMQFCLAGCLFKLGNFAESEQINAKIIEKMPLHAGAKVLKETLAKEISKKETASLVEKIEKSVTPPISQAYTSAPTYNAAIPAASSKPIFSGFDTISNELESLNELKKKREFQQVIKGATEIAENQAATPAQRERARIILAETAVQENKLEQALIMYDQILAKNPQASRAICGKGAIAAANSKLDEAKQYFNQALSINSRDDLALAGLGLCAYYQKDFDQAWNYYSKSIQSNPENNRSILGIIELGYHLKRLDQVEKVLQDYLEMHPADINFLYSLAGCLFAQGRIDQAKSELDKIALFDPNHQLANELRGMIKSGPTSSVGLQANR